MAPPMSSHAQGHRRDRPLCSSPESPLRAAAAGRWIRSGPGPPELVPPRPPVPATPTRTPRASLVTWGGRPRDARPQRIATVLESTWIPPGAAGARRESPGSRDARGPERVTNRSRTRQFRKPVWVIQVRAGTAKGLAPAQARQYDEPRTTTMCTSPARRITATTPRWARSEAQLRAAMVEGRLMPARTSAEGSTQSGGFPC
jgi:hypothetical protein